MTRSWFRLYHGGQISTDGVVVRDDCKSAILRLNSVNSIEVFILNYGHLDKAVQLMHQLQSCLVNVTILSAECATDDCGKHNSSSIVRRPGTDFYSALWNEVVKRSDAAIVGLVTGDVEIPDVQLLIQRAVDVFTQNSEQAWIYAPDVCYTHFRYRREALKLVSNSCYEVPTTDSTCWFLRRECLQAIGRVDTSINKFGYGLDILASLYAKERGKLCVRDFGVEIIHPKSKGYSDKEAQEQERAWVKSLGLPDRFFALKRQAQKLIDRRNPKVSYCTTTMGRLHHLWLTLNSNLHNNQYSDVEFVVLDYGSQDGVEEWVQQAFPDELKSGRLQFYRISWPTKFHAAHAKNCAHRLAHGEIVANVDADTFVLPEYGQMLREHLEAGSKSCVRLLPPDRSQFSLCGRIAMRREDLIRLGGYNESLQGYGFEDTNLLERAQRLGLKVNGLSSAYAACLEHSDSERTVNYDNKSTLAGRELNLARARAEMKTGYYANAGRAWGDLESDPYAQECSDFGLASVEQLG